MYYGRTNFLSNGHYEALSMTLFRVEVWETAGQAASGPQ